MSQIAQSSQDMIRWVDSDHQHFEDPFSSTFVLRPFDEDADQFFIEKLYGDRRPRMVSYSRDVTFRS